MPEAYEDLIAACEANGAKMYFEKEGVQWGAWVIRLRDGNTIVAESNGAGFPLLDKCYTPDPKRMVHNHYSHYIRPLLPDAVDQLLSGRNVPRKVRRGRGSY